jgi:hypothetical protein
MNPYLPPPAAANPVPTGDPLEHGADPTEPVRRLMIALDQPRADLEAAPVSWSSEEATALFEFTGFAAPFALVRRRADGVEGTLEFTHHPRRYFDFVARSDES